MQNVKLTSFIHRGKECIGIFFKRSETLNGIIQKYAGAKWSKTNGCWYIPLSKADYDKLLVALKGKVEIDDAELKGFLQARKTLATKLTTTVTPAILQNASIVYKPGKIHVANAHVLPTMEQQLKLKAYSPSTIKTYLGEMTQLLMLLNNIPADELTPAHLKKYLVHCYEKLKLTENSLHSRINGMKFYYEQVLKREKFFWEIPRPKKADQLPKVLGEKEIGRMFNAVANIKHKAILFTAYSAGLRVSEVVNLKLKDVDSSRMQLFIEKAKGKKDRYAGLSILLLDILRAYIKNSNPRPKHYVFENPLKPGEPYSVRSAQQIFKTAKDKAHISKDVGIHSLRHSFATHLLEKGIDIRYIKDLLGHMNIKTTEKYLHVKRETLINFPNVLDELNKTFTLDW